MTTRQVAFVGGAVGLAVCGAVLILLWWGVSGVLFIGSIDLASVLWPSFFMITTSWGTTLPGAVITVSSIAINCLFYAAIALILRWIVRFAVRG